MHFFFPFSSLQFHWLMQSNSLMLMIPTHPGCEPQGYQLRNSHCPVQNENVCSKSRSSFDPAIPLLGVDPKELKTGSQTDLRTLCSLAKRRKNSSVPRGTDGHTKCDLYIQWDIIQAKRGRSWDTCCMWMDVQDTVLSEINQSQKDQNLFDSTYVRYPERSNSIETESRVLVTRGRREGAGNQDFIFNWRSFPFMS